MPTIWCTLRPSVGLFPSLSLSLSASLSLEMFNEAF